MTQTAPAPARAFPADLAAPGRAPRAWPVFASGSQAAQLPVVLERVSLAYKARRGRLSVDRLTLTIGPGQIFGLLGPNGSGKTSTINMITGLVRPTAGRVMVFGREPGHARDRLGVLTQETALEPALSAWFTLDYHGRLFGIRKRERLARVLGALDFANLISRADDPVGSFSGGMARRLAIARTMLHGPRLVILDEPTLGVDPRERAGIWEHIRALPEAGVTVLLTTNYMEEAAALCDEVAIMDHGRLIRQDTPAELRRAYGSRAFSIRLRATPAAMRIGYHAISPAAGLRDLTATECEPEVTDVTVPREYLVEFTADGDVAMGAVVTALTLRNCVVVGVSEQLPSLEDVFLGLTGGTGS